MDNDTALQIRAALEALPAPEKNAIVTAYFGQCTYHEAAVALGESEATIKSRVRAGLKRMAEALDDSSWVVSS
ncbi:MAG: sigma factor-like helix-turn-helix DNA-binding protein [Ilumatobacteraceae bacterium]